MAFDNIHVPQDDQMRQKLIYLIDWAYDNGWEDATKGKAPPSRPKWVWSQAIEDPDL